MCSNSFVRVCAQTISPIYTMRKYAIVVRSIYKLWGIPEIFTRARTQTERPTEKSNVFQLSWKVLEKCCVFLITA